MTISFAAACGSNKNSDDDGDGSVKPDACAGIECNIVDCGAMGMPPTTISGTVFAPNGTLPLNGVNVYVPRDPLPPFVEGATCDRCQTTLPGSPIAQAISDPAGNFRLENVPAGADIPLVITTGKWRRQITIPSVTQCSDNALGAADTRLPKNKSEGDIPKIAITTGDADSLECLIRKLGIDDAEITTNAGTGRIHLYRGDGVASFKSGFPGGSGALANAVPFWSSVDTLKAYDIVFLSCEGSQMQDTNGGTNKTQPALDAMKAYADLGGRVFASHWHNIWIGGNFQDNNPGLAPPVWNNIATWTGNDDQPGNPVLVDEVSNPKGPQFAEWMLNVGGSTVRDEIQLQNGTERRTALTLDTSRAERWVQTQNAAANPRMGGPQMFQFTTPNETTPDQRCGKVVFTDMHVTGTSTVGNPYPDSCPGGAGNLTLTPQEKALAFMFFDIASCVGGIF
ncbi:MAG TPA: carboxypeptidase-like regulatory domain-containing protein [Kofleriaceae bacterium]|nr:carboxypeptidase-like regulatory domain-containing protein [Kofleriaceae bacterium]